LENFKNIEILDVPDITTLTFRKIHTDYLKVLLGSVFVILILVVTATLIINYNFQEILPDFISYIYLGVFLVFTFVVLFILIGFSRRKFAIREKDISYKSGVLIKKITTVPFSRVQHVELDEGPISRLFKLASISVFTAGDSSDDLVIKGIKKIEALKIKEFISEKINE